MVNMQGEDEIRTNLTPKNRVKNKGSGGSGKHGTENRQKGKFATSIKLIAFWAIVFLIGAAILTTIFPISSLTKVPISDVINRANNGEVSKLEISGDDVKVTVKGEESPTEESTKEDSSIYEQGLNTDAPVEVTIKPSDGTLDLIINLAIMILPTLALIGFFMFMMRQAQGANNQAMSFGKSKARLYGNDKKKVRFDEIAGNENAKQDLWEVVDFLKAPKKYEDLGARIPTGVLLIGPPGTGKTLMARAVAGEADVPFFSISGSEFVEMFAGVGASRVRDLFAKAKKNAPCIIFIDEIDAVARRREGRAGGAHEEHEQTLNQILVEMDGFENDTGVIVIAATNRMDMLDPALLRPGRFDRHVKVNLPERSDRLAILKVHFKSKPTDSTVDLESMAAKTAGSSGADLANIANESAIIAARSNKKVITNFDLTEAFEKVAIGPERKSKVMTEEERKISAYHEAGHAIVGHVLPNSDPVHKVTIIPRGQTGGVTWFLSPEDRSYKNVYEFKDILARAMGGRQAEKIIYGLDGITTGAGSDLKSASEIARSMVTEEGMGKNLRDQVFINEEAGYFSSVSKSYSEDTATKIDKEVKELMNEAAERAESVIKTNKKHLEALANALLEKETLEEEDVTKILTGTIQPREAKLHD